MIKDISKIVTGHVWKVTYLHRNVSIECGASYHLLGSQISQDLKIWFWLQFESYVSDWRFSKSQHLANYVFRHNAMAYDRQCHYQENGTTEHSCHVCQHTSHYSLYLRLYKSHTGKWKREICQNNAHPGIVFCFNAPKNAYFIVTPQRTNRILF